MGKKIKEIQNNHDSAGQVNGSGENSDGLAIRDIMNANVCTVSTGESALAAAKKMTQEQVSCMAVVENDQFRGIITHDDFVNKIIAQDKNRIFIVVEI